MDLNVERGVIERPFVPTIRYATPIIELLHNIMKHAQAQEAVVTMVGKEIKACA
ncbi:hypothetical protein QUF75_19500 [Desulfococcaceae bacterium HSG7]|nr:hypothetical protein [Desulfococcaceae bacterium HSG7]